MKDDRDGSMVTGALPPWLQMMRAAAQNAVSKEDVEAIVKAQVEKAKHGDNNARDFVFNHVLGGNQLKGATFVQNNYPAPGPAGPAVGNAPAAGEERPDRTPPKVYTASRRAIHS